jgi:hypothetical protein
MFSESISPSSREQFQNLIANVFGSSTDSNNAASRSNNSDLISNSLSNLSLDVNSNDNLSLRKINPNISITKDDESLVDNTPKIFFDISTNISKILDVVVNFTKKYKETDLSKIENRKYVINEAENIQTPDSPKKSIFDNIKNYLPLSTTARSISIQNIQPEGSLESGQEGSSNISDAKPVDNNVKDKSNIILLNISKLLSNMSKDEKIQLVQNKETNKHLSSVSKSVDSIATIFKKYIDNQNDRLAELEKSRELSTTKNALTNLSIRETDTEKSSGGIFDLVLKGLGSVVGTVTSLLGGLAGVIGRVALSGLSSLVSGIAALGGLPLLAIAAGLGVIAYELKLAYDMIEETNRLKAETEALNKKLAAQAQDQQTKLEEKGKKEEEQTGVVSVKTELEKKEARALEARSNLANLKTQLESTPKTLGRPGGGTRNIDDYEPGPNPKYDELLKKIQKEELILKEAEETLARDKMLERSSSDPRNNKFKSFYIPEDFRPQNKFSSIAKALEQNSTSPMPRFESISVPASSAAPAVIDQNQQLNNNKNDQMPQSVLNNIGGATIDNSSVSYVSGSAYYRNVSDEVRRRQ